MGDRLRKSRRNTLGAQGQEVRQQSWARGGPRMVYIDLDSVRPNPHQPRKDIDEESISALARSIREKGQVQPVSALPADDAGYYTLIAGERRWRACQKLAEEYRAEGVEPPKERGGQLLAVIIEGEPAELALIENLQRQDLNLLEEARGVHNLYAGREYTVDTIADLIGRDSADTWRLIQIPELPFADELANHPEVKLGHIAPLIGMEADQQRQLWELIKEGATVKDIRNAKRALQENPGETTAGADQKPPKRRVGARINRLMKSVASLRNELPRDLDDKHLHNLKQLRDELTEIIGDDT